MLQHTHNTANGNGVSYNNNLLKLTNKYKCLGYYLLSNTSHNTTQHNTTQHNPMPNGQRATGNGQRATGNGQRATGNGQRATGNGQRATGNGQRATGNGQRATGNGQRATGNGQRATGNGQRATGNGQRATGNGQRATGNGQRATGNGQRATGNGQRATGNGQRATGNGQRATPTGNANARQCIYLYITYIIHYNNYVIDVAVLIWFFAILTLSVTDMTVVVAVQVVAVSACRRFGRPSAVAVPLAVVAVPVAGAVSDV